MHPSTVLLKILWSPLFPNLLETWAAVRGDELSTRPPSDQGGCAQERQNFSWDYFAFKNKSHQKKKMFLGDKSEWFGEEETDISISHSTSFPIHQKKLSREIVNMGVFRKLREEGKVEIWAMQPAQGKLSL